MQFTAKNRPLRTGRRWLEVGETTPSEFHQLFEDALTDLYQETYYGVFMDRYPVKWGDDIPPTVVSHLAEEDTYACTDGDAVYVDVDGFYEWLKENAASHNDYVLDNIKAILGHEYTHIICEHAAYMRKVMAQYEDKVTHRCVMPTVVYHAHKITQEIQANRGLEVGRDTIVYANGVTEDAFPVTKGKKTYSEIFEALMSQAEKNAEAMAEAMSRIMDSLTSDSEARGGGKNKKKGENTSEGEKGSRNGSTQASKGKGEDGDGEKPMTQAEIEDAIQKARTADQQLAEEISSSLPGGSGGLDPYLIANHNQTAPTDEIGPVYQVWHKEKLAKELKKIKGYIRGNLTRVKGKTYSRPSLRRMDTESGLIAKGRKYMPNATPKVLVAMDNSGSMSGTSVTAVASAIGNAYKDLGRPTAGCYICTHEDSVHSVNNLRYWKKVVDNFSPTGGNCFNNVVIEANKLGCNVIFNIGDGLDCVTADYGETSTRGKAVEEFVSRGGIWIDILVTGRGHGGNFDGYRARDKDNGLDRIMIDLL